LNGDILQRKIIYDAYEEDFAKIQVFFKQPVMFNIESKPVLTWLDYFSGLGGIMGLVLAWVSSLCLKQYGFPGEF
jgi:hypothetical protein